MKLPKLPTIKSIPKSPAMSKDTSPENKSDVTIPPTSTVKPSKSFMPPGKKLLPPVLPLKSPSSTDNKSEDTPWAKEFIKRGYRKEHIPKTPPPLMSDGYGSLLTWVTNDQFILKEDEEFAIDIWLGRVNIGDWGRYVQEEQDPIDEEQEKPTPGLWG